MNVLSLISQWLDKIQTSKFWHTKFDELNTAKGSWKKTLLYSIRPSWFDPSYGDWTCHVLFHQFLCQRCCKISHRPQDTEAVQCHRLHWDKKSSVSVQFYSSPLPYH